MSRPTSPEDYSMYAKNVAQNLTKSTKLGKSIKGNKRGKTIWANPQGGPAAGNIGTFNSRTQDTNNNFDYPEMVTSKTAVTTVSGGSSSNSMNTRQQRMVKVGDMGSSSSMAEIDIGFETRPMRNNKQASKNKGKNLASGSFELGSFESTVPIPPPPPGPSIDDIEGDDDEFLKRTSLRTKLLADSRAMPLQKNARLGDLTDLNGNFEALLAAPPPPPPGAPTEENYMQVIDEINILKAAENEKEPRDQYARSATVASGKSGKTTRPSHSQIRSSRVSKVSDIRGTKASSSARGSRTSEGHGDQIDIIRVDSLLDMEKPRIPVMREQSYATQDSLERELANSLPSTTDNVMNEEHAAKVQTPPVDSLFPTHKQAVVQIGESPKLVPRQPAFPPPILLQAPREGDDGLPEVVEDRQSMEIDPDEAKTFSKSVILRADAKAAKLAPLNDRVNDYGVYKKNVNVSNIGQGIAKKNKQKKNKNNS